MLQRDDTPSAWLARLRRGWKLLLILPLAAGVAAVAMGLLRGPEYVSRSRFSPEQAAGQSSRLSGLASQFGLDAGLPRATESLQFYQEVLRSHDVLEAVVRTPLGTAGGGSLLAVYGAGDTEAERLRAAIEAASERLTIGVDPEASLLTLRTSGEEPELAVALNRALLAQLAAFNQQKRQSRATAERSFLEDRLAAARQELENAESALVQFLDRNVRFESARKQIEQERLQRRVALSNQLYVTLAESFEQARIDEVRNTPVITVIETPESTVQPSRSLRRDAIFGMVLGLVAALVVIVGRELMSRFGRAPAAEVRARADASVTS